MNPWNQRSHWMHIVMACILLSLVGCKGINCSGSTTSPEGGGVEFDIDWGSSDEFPLAHVGQPYVGQRLLSGGDGPYMLLTLLSEETTPDWMIFTLSSDGYKLVITGTPDQAGFPSAILRFVDQNGNFGIITADVEVE